MDVVYILGKGSRSNDAELRYSLRALEKQMVDLDTVYLVGERPDFLQNINHIAAVDAYPKYWKNAFEKTRIACLDERVSAEFLLMNDDFFMLSEFMGAEFPFYTVKGGSGGSSGMHDFGIHCPIRINKEMYLKMPIDVHMKADFSPRSFYGNFYGAPPVPTKDCIVRTGEGMKTFDEQTRGWEFFSIDDVAMLDLEFVNWIVKKYPEPSRYEK